MVTTVKLQHPFEYSWWVTLIAVVLGAIALTAIVFFLIKVFNALRKKKEVPRPAARKIAMSPDMIYRVKNQYIGRVQALLNNYTQNKVDKREGYQQLSALIREFVHEVTGINVENFTIKEVKAFGIKKLDVLMEEYYVPEFAEDEKAKDKDFAESCNKAVGVIKAWS
ncbi:hypothetical protein [Butyrivibrio sp. FCS006]|uniref:hypothetical protein n=1 Tax=Butyrivibrio sp. FCS006 TaxID=1280684 RepID=UPI001A985497|nr:hypothetical protein [Butyrivibrio sp. FCS006]